MTVVGRVGRGGVKPRGGKPFSVQPDASPAVAAKSRPRVASPSTKAPAETPMLGREVIEHEDQIAKAAKQRVRGTVGSVQAAAPPAKQAQRGLSQSAPKRSSGQHAEVHDRPQVAGRLNSKSLEERIATAEEDLERAREKTSAYFKQREAAGRSRKGGPKKAIDNAKERLWILKRQQAYPDRQLLQNCQFRGVRLPNGDLKTVKTIVKKGRGPDFIEIDGNKALLGELKSEWELTKSLSGGPGTTSGGSTAIASGSKLSGQLDIEARLLSYAQRINGKLVIRGYDVKTGLRVEGEFEPSQITRALFSATSGWGIGSEWAQ
jgi:hypothetical protein